MSNWRTLPLGEVISLQRGHDLPSAHRRAGSVPIVGAPGITGWHDEAIVKAPGVTIGRAGAAMGTAVYVQQDFWPLNTALYVTDFKGNDPLWVFHMLNRIDFSGFDSGSAQPMLNRNYIANIAVQVPPPAEQRRISQVVSALDALVESNRATIANLRRVAQCVFDRASHLGDVVPFASIATRVRESAAAHELTPQTPYLGLEHFAVDGAGIDSIGSADGVESSKSRFRAGDVLYGKLRPYFRKLDRPGFDGVCSTEIWVLQPRPPWNGAALEAVVARREFTDFAMAGSGGTRMPRANWEHLSTMPVSVPPPERRPTLLPRLEELWKARVELEAEIADVARTKDELVPLLMSGNVSTSAEIAAS